MFEAIDYDSIMINAFIVVKIVKNESRKPRKRVKIASPVVLSRVVIIIIV